jgi:RNA polymerase sigma-70 factor (ECF subfamily)
MSVSAPAFAAPSSEFTGERGPASVRDLVVESGEEILAMARSMSRCSADAEDLAQDAIVRALRFAGQFTPGTNFGAWMRTIVRNTAINRTRHERTAPRPARSEDGLAAIESAPARPGAPTDPEIVPTSVDRDELSAPLAKALEDLPDDYRVVLHLWAVGGYRYREIAEIVGCPIGTVMSRLHRARTQLRRGLDAVVDARGTLLS